MVSVMKEYKIRVLNAAPADWNDIPAALLDETPWMKDYVPQTQAQVVFVPGDAFYTRLTCRETNPKAVYHNFFEDVYKDSCMEFFAAWDNSKPDYINIEMNSNGAALIAVGPDRNARTRIDEKIEKPFCVTPSKTAETWSVTVRIPLADLAKIYGMDVSVFKAGYTFRGNFYKCGDETPVEHYNMWNRVGTEAPDYHRPEYFGTLVIGE